MNVHFDFTDRHVVIFGGLPTIRARSSFHSPFFHNCGHCSAVTGHLNAASSFTVILPGSPRKSKFRTWMPPDSPLTK